jgi:transposase-like protein
LDPVFGRSSVIHRHGISSSQLYAWRQQLARRVDGQPAAASFARVAIATEVHGSPVPVERAKPPAQVPATARMSHRSTLRRWDTTPHKK